MNGEEKVRNMVDKQLERPSIFLETMADLWEIKRDAREERDDERRRGE
jgi:hypothetical protein